MAEGLRGGSAGIDGRARGHLARGAYKDADGDPDKHVTGVQLCAHLTHARNRDLSREKA